MAIAPQNNEAFLREVDEQVRIDTAQRFWKRWGAILIGLVITGLAVLGGWLWWQSDRQAKAGLDGEKLSLALDNLAGGRTTNAETELKALTDSASPGNRASSQLALPALRPDGNR